MQDVIQIIRETGVVAIARRVPAGQIVPMAKALYAGGIRLLEITFDQQAEDNIAVTTAAIRSVCAAMGDAMAVGAGTVLTEQQAEAAVAAGASFLLSATVNQAVIQKAKALGVVMIPGAMTPTEIYDAYAYGADIIKVFPAGSLGTTYIKALRGPLPQIPLLAVGSIDVENTAAYIRAGTMGVGVGGKLMKPDFGAANWERELTQLAAGYIAAAKEAQNG